MGGGHCRLHLGGVRDIDLARPHGGFCLWCRSPGISWPALCLRYVSGRAVESLIGELAKHIGDGWLLAIVAIIFAVVNSGLIPKWLGDRQDEHARERADVAEDRRTLIANYEMEATNQRRWRKEDAERYEKEIARLAHLVDKMSEAALLSERGNARLRHAVNNLMTILISQYDLAILRNERPPFPLDGFRNLFGISADLDEKLRSLFGDADLLPDPPSSTEAC